MEIFRRLVMWYGLTDGKFRMSGHVVWPDLTDGKPVAGGCEAAEEVAGAVVEAVVDATEAVVEVVGRPSVTWL